jgi:formamidopyrimidine-DNA glycosylase
MPELPEVENIKLQLEKYLVDHVVEKVDVKWKKSLPENESKLVGGKVKKVRRFGKALTLDLDNGYSAIIHLKMSGQLIYRGPNLRKTSKFSEKVKGGVPGKHTHVIFSLSQGGALYFNDFRKFGWIKVVKTSEVEKTDFIKKLGPEPFGFSQGKPSNRLTFQKFTDIVRSTNRSIKTLLMDQSKIAGVGNIYANDALWDAKIHPERKAMKLSSAEQNRLFKAIEKVLKEGIKRGGASDQAYVTPDGKEGNYQEHFLIYGKEGEICPRPACRKEGVKIKKIKIGGRGTYFCPTCQKV